MRCLSTRAPPRLGADRGEAGRALSAAAEEGVVGLCEAIGRGMAPDGGLYLPEKLPHLDELRPKESLALTAHEVLAPFFQGEPLAPALQDICRAAFTFDAPLRALGGEDRCLELFHGPTAAFKDFGARFLAECLARLSPKSQLQTVLVATSGDTGAAVAAAFHRRPGFRVVILYPEGRVAARQAHQLGAFGDNVRAFRVAGTFDDCQRMVKSAFADASLRALRLMSANSISLGRLLPQMAYYAHAALALGQTRPVNFVVPTGNLGNALACIMARHLGLPIGRVVLATNANRVVPDFLATGQYQPRPSVATLANAMDVGAPSNLERLRALYGSEAVLAAQVEADWVDDQGIRETIVRTWRDFEVAICPHTACGVEVLRRLRDRGERGTWVVAATAHPAKFDTIVEPLIGRPVAAPPALAAILSRPSHAEPLEASEPALARALAEAT